MFAYLANIFFNEIVVVVVDDDVDDADADVDDDENDAKDYCLLLLPIA